jgi:hypothetical protein
MLMAIRRASSAVSTLACRASAGGGYEIVDRVLKLLEHVLLALAVAGDVGDGPHGMRNMRPAG